MCNDLSNQMIDISTHDLARRSTLNFLATSSTQLFQLTTSQGGRQGSKTLLLLHIHFNSRPRKEVDGFNALGGEFFDISTHDLARRSTQH